MNENGQNLIILVRIVLSTFKLASLFSTKDKVPYGLKSYLIYKFLCAASNVSYEGETYRHISARTHEHFGTVKSSIIYLHLLKNPQFKSICNENCLSPLYLAKTKYTLKLEKGMYIKWVKPLPKETGKIYFALNSCIEERSNILVCPLILCH